MNTLKRRVFALLMVCVLALSVAPAAAQDNIIGPDEYPENVNPLTGLVVSNPTVLERRPMAVKVSNFPAEVRPQSGLSQADIVFEHEAEGGTTRLTALFLTKTPTKVGSMRSARLIDLEIPAMYRALFVFSGASEGVRQRIFNSTYGENGRAFYADAWGEPFAFRDTEIDPPHNFFANPEQIWYAAEERGVAESAGPVGTAYSATVPTGGTSASIVDIAYHTEFVRWFYVDGEPLMDRDNNQQIVAENVVILEVDHVEDRTILEDEVGAGHYSIEIQLWGEGPCHLFRDGQRFDCRWQRADDFSMLSFYTLDGNVLPLKPGVTWFQVVRPGFTGLTVTE
jgi:hypothetical protein